MKTGGGALRMGKKKQQKCGNGILFGKKQPIQRGFSARSNSLKLVFHEDVLLVIVTF